MEKYTKTELKKYFLNENKSGYKSKEKHIIKNFDNLIDLINEFNSKSEFPDDIPFTQKLYNYLYNINKIPKCETCYSEIKWRNRFTEGYLKNCSKKCRDNSKKRIEKIKETNLKKYGVDSVSKVDKFKKKRIKTYVERYGVENIFENTDVREKTDKTNLEKYGTKSPIQSDLVKANRKKNNIKKYGVDNPSKLESVKLTLKETNLKKYGVDSVMKVDSIKNKNTVSKTKDTIRLYREILGNHINFSYNRGNLIVENQCTIHPKYEINNTVFYYRVIKYKIENPCICCNPISENVSIKENEVKEFINELGIETEKIRVDKKELNINIKDFNLGIEFDGLYWHSDYFKDKNYHLDKTLFFRKNNINVIHLFEDEWVYKKDIVKSVLKNKLGLIENKIFARKCVIKEIDNKTSERFLNENHLQGGKKSKIRLGLYNNDELVSVMTFSKEFRRTNEIKNYELDRFCNKINTSVIGGASRLFKHFLKNYSPKRIITFADIRYSNGELYNTLGFTHLYDSPPNFWYFKRADGVRLHRFNYRKSELIKRGYDKNKTANQIMIDCGYHRIYDCGNMKFEMIL